ncbi:MAG: NAD(P)-binding domain-containing protein, partial [Candidatus Acidiferrales bacterium]
MNAKPIRRIALIGFGEAGGIFGQDFAATGFEVSATDVLLRQEHSRVAMLEKARRAKVRAFDSLPEAVRDADLVISAVTCSAAAEVADEAKGALCAGQVFLDINS